MNSGETIWVAVQAASGMADAAIIAGRLETEGIPTRLEYEAAGIIYAVTVDGLGEVKIMVPRENLERAREILAHTFEREELPWEKKEEQ